MASHVLDDPEVRGIYLAHVAMGFGPGKAALVIGCRGTAVKHYIATHPDFAELVAEALDLPTEDVELALYKAALEGDVMAMRAWLAANKAEKYGLKSNPALNVTLNVSTPEALQALSDMANRRRLELETGTVLDS